MAFRETVSKIFEKAMQELSEEDFFRSDLENLNLLDFENNLFSLLTTVYNELATSILSDFVSGEYFKSVSKSFAEKVGMGKLKKRDTGLQLRTGKTIEVKNYYAEQNRKAWQGSRHLLHALFGTIGKATPCYYSSVSMFSVICPSFEIAGQMLSSLHVETNYDRVRDLSLRVGKKSLESRAGLALKEGETLSGKTVIISIDGGRSRFREYKDQLNPAGTHKLFDTPWHEPKLFVVQILDEKTGKQSKTELPVYDCTFGHDESFALLSKYLRLMEIEKAKKVQFLADGATWIWKRAEKMLRSLGVKKENIIQTLDYYHAVQHLNTLVKSLPKKIEDKERSQLLKQLKALLWEGKTEEMAQQVKARIKRTNETIRRELKYFKKHTGRCRYGWFKEHKLLCGSGIIESGIRRIINLRFKSPSAFWEKENLEGLIFLRATLLSGRWKLMINNLTKI